MPTTGSALLTRRLLVAGLTAGTFGLVAACTTQPVTDRGAGDSTPPASSDGFNEADVMFAQMMIPHHEQAVEMSDIVLAKTGLRPEVVRLAEQIKAAQAPEIEQLTSWLTSWNRPTAAPSSGHGGHGGGGMLGADEIRRLRDAPAPEAERLFLAGMIAHHEGAIAMAGTEVRSGRHPGAVAMARQIVATQQLEIDTMRTLLG